MRCPAWKRPEAKEWAILLKFLTAPAPAGLGGTIPTGLYAGATATPPRVIKQ